MSAKRKNQGWLSGEWRERLNPRVVSLVVLLVVMIGWAIVSSASNQQDSSGESSVAPTPQDTGGSLTVEVAGGVPDPSVSAGLQGGSNQATSTQGSTSSGGMQGATLPTDSASLQQLQGAQSATPSSGL